MGPLVADRGQAQRRVAGWLYAAERIAALSGRVGSEQTAELVDECLSEAQQRSLNLQRLHIALSSGVGDGRLERLLSLLKIAPELRAAYLPRGQGRDLPEVWRRRLCLERWDVNVSLGLLEAAARQRECVGNAILRAGRGCRRGGRDSGICTADGGGGKRPGLRDRFWRRGSWSKSRGGCLASGWRGNGKSSRGNCWVDSQRPLVGDAAVDIGVESWR